MPRILTKEGEKEMGQKEVEESKNGGCGGGEEGWEEVEFLWGGHCRRPTREEEALGTTLTRDVWRRTFRR